MHENRLPDKLETLVPSFLSAVPENPFTGKPLEYRKRDVGYVVYQADLDREDDETRTTVRDLGERQAGATGQSEIAFAVDR